MAAGTTLSFLNSANFTVGNPITIAGDPFFAPPANTTQTLSGVISDGGAPGTLEMKGAGTLVLSAVNTYTGPTNVNAGALQVNGSIATSSLTSVNNGGTLAGIGTVGNTQINGGGIFAPGASVWPAHRWRSPAIFRSSLARLLWCRSTQRPPRAPMSAAWRR